MKISKHGSPQPPEDPHRETNTSSNEQEARNTAAEEAVCKDREVILHYELVRAFFETFPPAKIGEVLNGFSIKQIVTFLERMPQCSDPEFKAWSNRYFNSLAAFRIAGDVQRLENLGVKPQTLAVAMTLIKLSPTFDAAFRGFGTEKRERNRRAKSLLTPIPALQDLAKLFGEIPPLLSQDFPNISRIVAELKLLSSILNWGDFIYNSLGANSLVEASKFAMASLVREASGKFLDRQVSNLTAAALGNYDYDENRHRVWRINNYKRLSQNVPILTRFLISLNAVVAAS